MFWDGARWSSLPLRYYRPHGAIGAPALTYLFPLGSTWIVVGGALFVAGLGGFLLFARAVLWRRLVAIITIWLGLALISPILLIVIAMPPAIVVVRRRLSDLEQGRLRSVEQVGADPVMRDLTDQYVAAGYRYAATLVRHAVGGAETLVVLRMPDLAGWIEITPRLAEIQHRFGERSIVTLGSRCKECPPHLLAQPCADLEMTVRIHVHRRLLAALAARGLRPDRLTDEEVVAVIRRQLVAGDLPATWRRALRVTIEEELAHVGRVGCAALVDRPDFEERLHRWLAPADTDPTHS